MENSIDMAEKVRRSGFETAALDCFRLQYHVNQVYRDFCDLLGKDPNCVHAIADIPFLPIEMFRHHKVICTGMKTDKVFESSGTTGQETSKHFVADLSVYRWSLQKTFGQFFGSPEQYCILALLPTYVERDNSSLVYMVNELMKMSLHPSNGFYLNELPQLVNVLKQLQSEKQKTLLFGVSFALLDLAEQYELHLPDLTIIETGGMKGKRKEITRDELHSTISSRIKSGQLCSEYGMTELLSQAYAMKNGRFQSPPWMRILIRDQNDPFNLKGHGSTGGINVIDLANVNSCAFIATYDLGRTNDDGSFEVLGRFDHSELRGCNLLIH